MEVRNRYFSLSLSFSGAPVYNETARTLHPPLATAAEERERERGATLRPQGKRLGSVFPILGEYGRRHRLRRGNRLLAKIFSALE